MRLRERLAIEVTTKITYRWECAGDCGVYHKDDNVTKFQFVKDLIKLHGVKEIDGKCLCVTCQFEA